ncbi:MAG: protein kinase [Myxococcales bacterium]|nr:protein kinase [Myxococcales bacterium]
MSTGTRRTDGRPVALKFAVATRGRRADAELHHEHQLLARLPGSVVRRAVALETTAEGATVLVLEHDEHEPISSVAGRLTPPELLALALRVCEAIAAVHAHGVIHGRLSPSNILIDPERRAVKLQGFTFASRIESAAPDAREPSPHAPAHELRYLAPEQTGRVNRGVDPRADLYALGVVLYELLAGRPAFPEEGAQELLHALLARTPTRLAELDPAIPQPLSDIIARLMAKDADERHEDAVQLITALSLVSAELEPRRPTRPRSPASALRSPPLTFGRARELARLHAELEAGAARAAASRRDLGRERQRQVGARAHARAGRDGLRRRASSRAASTRSTTAARSRR